VDTSRAPSEPSRASVGEEERVSAGMARGWRLELE
jgi:hypothetical protein